MCVVVGIEDAPVIEGSLWKVFRRLAIPMYLNGIYIPS